MSNEKMPSRLGSKEFGESQSFEAKSLKLFLNLEVGQNLIESLLASGLSVVEYLEALKNNNIFRQNIEEALVISQYVRRLNRKKAAHYSLEQAELIKEIIIGLAQNPEIYQTGGQIGVILEKIGVNRDSYNHLREIDHHFDQLARQNGLVGKEFSLQEEAAIKRRVLRLVEAGQHISEACFGNNISQYSFDKIRRQDEEYHQKITKAIRANQSYINLGEKGRAEAQEKIIELLKTGLGLKDACHQIDLKLNTCRNWVAGNQEFGDQVRQLLGTSQRWNRMSSEEKEVAVNYLFELLRAGETIVKACSLANISPATFWGFLEKDPVLKEQFKEAQEIGKQIIGVEKLNITPEEEAVIKILETTPTISRACLLSGFNYNSFRSRIHRKPELKRRVRLAKELARRNS